MDAIQGKVDTLLAQMTLDEKIAQVGSCWIYELLTGGDLDNGKVAQRLGQGIGQITRIAGGSTLEPAAAARVGNRIQKFLVEHTRLHIPAILHEESCSGAMVRGGSAFPQMIALASTFQPELAEQMTQVIRAQLLAIGARQSLAPVLDVARDPRWGRTEETFGEDPLLVSHFGVAYVRGLQGADLAQGVLATGKHFIAHSQSQGGRNCAPVHIGAQELLDVFAMPFQAAIRQAGIATLMNAYPELDGEVVAASRRILTDLLRGQFGFDGLVVSDYEAVSMLHNFHYVAPDHAAAACLALQAGIDVELPTTLCYGTPLKLALESGDLDLATLETAVRRHLQKKFELNLFENPYRDEARVLEVFETEAQRQLAQQIATQGMVLLKNDGLLPLRKDLRSLAVIGPNAAGTRCLLGDYSYAATLELTTSLLPDGVGSGLDPQALAGASPRIVSILDGIRAALSPQTTLLHAPGCAVLDADPGGFAEALEMAAQAEAVVLVLGDLSGLTPPCTTGETRDSAHLRLPGVQEALARAVLATGKPVVAVLVTGRPYALPWLDESANAILEAWLPGEEGGAAVAALLFGDAEPAGRLPITFPRHVGQLPVYYNRKPSGLRSHWYGDYVTEKAAPLYPFGHGLSYTTFAYRDLSITPPAATVGGTVDIRLRVTNTGERHGIEVVQLYTRDEFSSTPRPIQELKGYARLSLAPGESNTVTFHLPVDLLAFPNSDLDLVLEAGRIQVMLGSSSADIRLTGAFELTGAPSMPVNDRLFVCPVTIQ